MPGFTIEGGFEDKLEATTTKKERKWEKMLHNNNEKEKELCSIISTVTLNLKQKSSTTQGIPEIANFDYFQKCTKDYKSMKKELLEDSDSDISNETKEKQKNIF